MICNRCGANSADGSNFCNNCGTPLESTPNQSTPWSTDYQSQQSPWAQNYQTQQSPWTQNYQSQPTATSKPGQGFAIAALVCGICSFFIFGIILGVLGIVFGIVAIKQGSKSGMATAGIVCGAIGLILYILLLIFAFQFFRFY